MAEQEPTYEVPDESQAKTILEGRYEEAACILEDQDQVERLLQRLEKRLVDIPVAGEALSNLPALISLVRSYAKGEYKDIPVGAVVAVVAAILYVASTIDLVPDIIPLAGYLDDAAVVAACLSFVGTDLEEYRAWRLANGKQVV